MAVDVIVVGAGGGGPVTAKELAALGLDVILLEAGPFYTNLEDEWTHLENDANNPLTGYFRFGPADRTQPAWYRETPQNSFLWQLSGVGGTTLHYYGNCPRAMPGVFMGYDGADAAAYDPAVFPFTYDELIPYYEWVEATLPVQTAAMGTKEEVFFRGAATLGIPHNTTKNVSQPSYRAQENGGPGRARVPRSQWLHFLRVLLPGLQRAVRLAVQLEGQAHDAHVLHPNGAYRGHTGLVGSARQGHHPYPQCVCHRNSHHHRQRRVARQRRYLA
jgi:choline dehydrogenase-like flavoprotein